jgi:hypothetical protein
VAGADVAAAGEHWILADLSSTGQTGLKTMSRTTTMSRKASTTWTGTADVHGAPS